MAKEDNNPPKNCGRRHFLEKATGAVAGAGIAAASWPFVKSMNPSTDIASNATTEIELDVIELGATQTFMWQGKPIFVMHRTAEQIAAMAASPGSDIDPQPDEQRVQRPQWLVVIGLCTHLGCVPARHGEGWLCPCHGSAYDNSGRVIKGPAPRNLDLPPYHFEGDGKILVGKA